MAFNYISAAEAASLIKHGYNIGLSGFTPAGTAKAVTAELAKIAEAYFPNSDSAYVEFGSKCTNIIETLKKLGILSGIIFLAALVLFFVAGFLPGLAWLMIAFLISPYGLPLAAAWLVGIIGGANSALKDFIFG